jgi:hypothetical protein
MLGKVDMNRCIRLNDIENGIYINIMIWLIFEGDHPINVF